MKPERFVIIPNGGLGNRLLPLLTGYIYTRATGQRLNVLWLWDSSGRKQECNATFKDLFTIPSGVNTLSIDEKNHDRKTALEPYRQAIRRREAEGMTDPGHPLYASKYTAGIEDKIQEAFGAFVPESMIDPKPASLTMIGIHVRRGDVEQYPDRDKNRLKLERTPLEAYEKLIDRFIEAKPHAVLLLSTDSVKVRERFIGKYGDCMVVQGKPLDRSSAGMKNALTDLINLSRCELIIGSFFSSFSLMAAWIGKTQIHFIGGNDFYLIEKLPTRLVDEWNGIDLR